MRRHVLWIVWQRAIRVIFVNHGLETAVFRCEIAFCVRVRMYWIHDDAVWKDRCQQGPFRFRALLPKKNVSVNQLERLEVQLLSRLTFFSRVVNLELSLHDFVTTQNRRTSSVLARICIHTVSLLIILELVLITGADVSGQSPGARPAFHVGFSSHPLGVAMIAC